MTGVSGQPWRSLDPAVLTRLRPDIGAIGAAVTEEIRAAALREPLDAATTSNLRAAVDAALGQFFAETGNPETPADREVHRAQGHAQHAAGRTLEEMLGFYQLGGLGTWRWFTAHAYVADLPIRALGQLGEALFAYVAELSAAAADGYAEARSQAARAGQATRDRLLGLLLADPPARADDLEQASREAGWPLPEAVAVAVSGKDVASTLLDRMPGRVLIGRHHDLACVIMPGDRIDWYLDRLGQLVDRRRAGLGPLVPLAQVARSRRRAEAVWRLMRVRTFGGGPVVRAVDHQIDLLLTADPDLAAEFATTSLAPLAKLGEPARRRLTETLAAWLAEPDQPQAIGVRLHVHVQTVRYRLRQLRRLFGETIDD
ncbi:MAG TPA: helix-turn-helix domain-containing protein, partial [Amycolatopsis sp.]|nr:helix-turn-helix domain-containing protein [Amycolatopsis sp.]